MYENLTRLIDALETDNIGDWVFDEKSKGTIEDPIQASYVKYSDVIKELVKEIYDFSKDHPEYKLNKYRDILVERGLDWKSVGMKSADIATADGQLIMALLMSITRMDRFCEGALLGFCKEGFVVKWLKRLKELDGR